MTSESKLPLEVKTNKFKIHGRLTEIVCLGFENSIFVIVSQVGRIGSLLKGKITHSQPFLSLLDLNDSHNSTKPNQVSTQEKHLISTQYLLGNGSGTLSSPIYEIMLSQIHNLVMEQNPFEKRSLYLGVGLERNILKEGFESELKDTVKSVPGLVGRTRVW